MTDRNPQQAERVVDVVAEGFYFLEGPRWHDGRLYFSDFYRHRVFTADERGNVTEVCEVPGQPSGLGFTPEGDLLVVSMLDRRLMRLSDGTLSEVADLSNIAPYHINDLLVDRQGRAYVGNFGSDVEREDIRPTVVVRVDPGGDVEVAADGLVFPNGMALTPDGSTMLVAETFAYRISAFDVDDAGRLSNRRVWASFADAPARQLSESFAAGVPTPDGICLDAEGALWIGDATGSAALRVAAGGEIVEAVPARGLAVYAVALGGEDGRSLYMCAAPRLGTGDPSRSPNGVLLRCRVDVPAAG